MYSRKALEQRSHGQPIGNSFSRTRYPVCVARKLYLESLKRHLGKASYVNLTRKALS